MHLASSQGPVVQSVVSLTSSLRVIYLTVLADSIYNILIFFAEKMCKSYSHFFSKKFQHICVSLDVNFNESLTNNVVSFEQLGPDHRTCQMKKMPSNMRKMCRFRSSCACAKNVQSNINGSNCFGTIENCSRHG